MILMVKNLFMPKLIINMLKQFKICFVLNFYFFNLRLLLNDLVIMLKIPKLFFFYIYQKKKNIDFAIYNWLIKINL